jgi:CxxC-x17-CxxC domain-containing protein
VMSERELKPVSSSSLAVDERVDELSDLLICCMDCREDFVWSVGEQRFFHDKQLQNPPKRCKECKKAKNHRIATITENKLTGKRQRIEVKAQCAKCSQVTTVPFYPSQGRPVYCRTCFQTMSSNAESASG